MFTISGTLGTLSSAVGYAFNFIAGELTMPERPKPVIRGLASTVEQVTRIPELITQNGDYITIEEVTISPNIQNSKLDQQQPADISRLNVLKSSQSRNADSAEPKADVRLVQADLMDVEKPVIDFYDLCSYHLSYCE